MTFITRLTDQLWSTHGENLQSMAVVFPTRRAVLFFRKELQRISALTGKPLWSPEVFSINDFVTRLSPYVVPERHTLLFTLFNVYSRIVTSIRRDFEEFYSWGSMILSDFDEIDRNLVDVALLFRTLREYKDSYDVGLDESHELYQRYVSFWGDLSVLYEQFRRDLREGGNAYAGMALREVAEHMGNEDGLKWSRVIFAGFNALNRAEELIMKHLKENDRADLYWDMDHYFTDDPGQEAGDFFRRNLQVFNLDDPQWIDGDLRATKKIYVIGVPTRVAQARAAGTYLQELILGRAHPGGEAVITSGITAEDDAAAVEPPAVIAGRTAIVLPDETMLFPMLNSLPASVDKLNVTMGYSLRNTFLYSLVSYYLDLHGNAKESGEDILYYHKDVKNLLTHSVIHLLGWDKTDEILERITSKNLIFVPLKEISGTDEPLFRDLFAPWKNAAESLHFFLRLFERLAQNPDDEGIPALSPLGQEYVYHFYTLFMRILELLESAEIDMGGISTFRRFMSDIIGSTSVPFTGEPLEGLQIMGMLETQLLDFENLFILSMNEGIIPTGKTTSSFIPFEVRTAFGLPTYRERDALFAYHFYRLLKRARKIYLFYITQTDEFGKNEKSRFLEQILFEYKEANKEATIVQTVATLRTEKKPAEPIKVQKSQIVMSRLIALGERGFSPSVLNNYIMCPLRFYFQDILGLKEEEELTEAADRAQLGSVIHAILEEFYSPLAGKEVTEADLIRCRFGLEDRIARIYRDKTHVEDLATGKNRLFVEIIRRLVERFLEQEKSEAPFELRSLEKKIRDIPLEFDAGGLSYRVNLKGFVDRIDVKESVTRIIDYKTGNIGSLNVDDFESLVAVGDTRKEAFQLLFYLYLYWKAFAPGDDFSAFLGIYRIRRVSEGIDFVKRGRKPRTFTLQDVQQFEESLRALLGGIFDSGRPFEQTRDPEKACRICSFITLCNRQGIL